MEKNLLHLFRCLPLPVLIVLAGRQPLLPGIKASYSLRFFPLTIYLNFPSSIFFFFSCWRFSSTFSSSPCICILEILFCVLDLSLYEFQLCVISCEPSFPLGTSQMSMSTVQLQSCAVVQLRYNNGLVWVGRLGNVCSVFKDIGRQEE